jgi:hypothetical protein
MKTILATLSVLLLSALAACRNPAMPPEPPPTETKPAAGAEQIAE